MNTPKPDKTIDELFAEFLTDQEARLSPRTYVKYEGIIDLYRSYLECYWPGHSGKEYDAITKTQGTYCGTFGAEDITSGFSEFLGYFMPRKVITEDDESIRELVGEAARDLPASQKLLDDLYDWLSETGPLKSRRRIEGHFLILRIGPRQIWLESMIPGDPEIGPIPVPRGGRQGLQSRVGRRRRGRPDGQGLAVGRGLEHLPVTTSLGMPLVPLTVPERFSFALKSE
jgi:hypothetical protein